MRIDVLIEALRKRCPTFGGRVGGYGEYAHVVDDAALVMPCAYVVSLADTAGENEKANGYMQTIRDRFGVLVALPNRDIRGQSTANLADEIRAELNSALLGWEVSPEYYGIVYDGKSLFEMNRSASWYSYEYYAEFVIGDEDIADHETWHSTELDNLPEMDGMDLTIDAIDPHDDNKGPHGPDGVPEGVLKIDFEK